MKVDFTEILYDINNPDDVGILGADADDGANPDELSTPVGPNREIVLQVIKELTDMGGVKSGSRVKLAGRWFRHTKITSEISEYVKLRQIHDYVPTLDDLQVNPVLHGFLTKMGLEPGLYLFSGPMGSGKTTLASAVFGSWLETFGGIGTTIEEPPEYPLERAWKNGAGRCIQVPVEDEDWETPFKNVLRTSSRYLLIGEIRSPLASMLAIKAASKGAAVVATVHAQNVEDTITSMTGYCRQDGGRPSDLAAVLKGIFRVSLRSNAAGGKRTNINPLFGTDSFYSAMFHNTSVKITAELNNLRQAIENENNKNISEISRLQMNFLQLYAQQYAAKHAIAQPAKHLA